MSSWDRDLADFRASHRLTRRALAGLEWEYVACGRGPGTLLILPGGLAVAETAFRYIRRFEPHRRVIAPTYPEAAASMAQLTAGLAELIQAEGAPAAVIGGSYSGLVAQCLVRAAPPLVERLVLSDTGVPRPGRARAMAALAPLIRRGPLPLLRGLLRAGVGLSMAQLPAQRSFWWRYFSARIAGISRAACLSHLAIWRDFDRGCVFSPADLAAWPGEMLIIEAEFDGLFRRPEQERLRDLYPLARVHTFANSPHGASLARMDDYIELIAGFLGL